MGLALPRNKCIWVRAEIRVSYKGRWALSEEGSARETQAESLLMRVGRRGFYGQSENGSMFQLESRCTPSK